MFAQGSAPCGTQGLKSLCDRSWPLTPSRQLNTCDALVDLAANEIISQLAPENVVEEVFWNPPA